MVQSDGMVPYGMVQSLWNGSVLVEWFSLWQLGFNEDKCKTVQIQEWYKRCTPLSWQIPVAKRIFIDQDLKFHVHVTKAANKASRLLGPIRATFTCLDKTTVPRHTIVQPHLEYGNVIWNPRYKRDKLEIEKIQRRATKLIAEIKQLSYEERLRQLELPSLEHRRRRGDMLQTYKIINGIDRVNH